MDVERIVDSVVARFIGTKHERDIKVIQPVVTEINALEPAMQKLTDAELAAYTPKLKAEVQSRLEGVEDNDPDIKQKLQGSDRAGDRTGVCGGARSWAADAGNAAFRCAADRRHRAASGQNRGNENRRRKNAGGDFAGLFECAWPGVACTS